MFNRNSKANTKGKYTTYTGYLKCNECKCNLRKFTRPNSDNNLIHILKTRAVANTILQKKKLMILY